MWTQVTLLIAGITLALVALRAFFLTFYHKRNTHVSKELRGKLAVVTGGTSGVGRETVIDLYIQGAVVVFLGRKAERVTQIIVPRLLRLLEQTVATKDYSQETIDQDIQDLKNLVVDKQGNVISKRLHFRKCDLADLAQVKQFSEYVHSLNARVKLLINNAGGVFIKHSTTVQGFESTIGLNVLSHFYLTELLFDRLDDEARIINLSSVMNLFLDNHDGDMNLDYYFPAKKGYNEWVQYSRSKLGVVLYTAGLQQILDRKGVNAKAISLHPGAVMTDFMSTMYPIVYTAYRIFKPFAWCFMKNAEEGAQTTLFCCYMPYDQLKGGQYYSDCRHASRSRGATQKNIDAFMTRITGMIQPVIEGGKLHHLA